MDIDIQKIYQVHIKFQNLLKLTQIEKDRKVNSFNTVQSLKRVKAITSQNQGNHTIRTVFFSKLVMSLQFLP